MVKPRVHYGTIDYSDIDLMIIVLNNSYCDEVTNLICTDINGIFLDEALEAHKLTNYNYYITSYIKDLNIIDIKDVNKKMLHLNYKNMYDEIMIVNPKLILLLGTDLISYFFELTTSINSSMNNITKLRLFNPEVIGSRKKADKEVEIKYTDNYFNFIGCYGLEQLLTEIELSKNKKKALFRECLFLIEKYLSDIDTD